MSILDERRRILLASGNLKFYITYNNVIYEYEFKKGMKWSDFISSPFNDNKFSLSGSLVKYNGYTVSNGTPVSSTTEVLEVSYTTVVPLVIYNSSNSSLSTGVGYSLDMSTNKIKLSLKFVRGTGIKLDGNASSSPADFSYCAYIGASESAGFDFTKYGTLSITANLYNNNTSYPGYVGYYSGNVALKSITPYANSNKSPITSQTATTVAIDIRDVIDTSYIYIETSKGPNQNFFYVKNITLS